MMNELTELIRNDMKPAFGVTEPGAIAFAVATARSKTSGHITKVKVALNSGMYKNAFTCGIPNSSNFGNLYAAALGAVAADAKLELESLTNVTEADDAIAAKLVAEGKVDVYLDHIGSEITIDATVETDVDSCIVSIRHSHTNIVRIVLNGEVVFSKDGAETEATNDPSADHSIEPMPHIHKYTLHDIYKYVLSVPADDLAFIREAFAMNIELLNEGLNSGRAVIAHELYLDNGKQIISKDVVKTAQLLCNGAIEARVLGLSRPAMSITGSGSHGIIATMPLYALYKINQERFAGECCSSIDFESSSAKPECEDALLLRATALSYLITMYIKEYSGKLSAFCGCGIAAGTGMACGIALMQGASEEQIGKVILNMSSGIVGMVCDGGNHSCAMKGIVATDAAFRSARLALNNVCISGIHGINGLTPEDTMRNMGIIASEGMVETEATILKIMENK